MARKPYKPDIEYIQKYYSYGSEAKVIEFKPLRPEPKTKPKTKRTKPRLRTVEIDAVAFCGLMVTIALALVLVSAVIRFSIASESYEVMESHLVQLRDENIRLSHEYHTGYDIAEVEETALTLGMIPAEEAKTMTVSVTVPQREPEMTAWREFVWFLSGLFA